MDSAVYLLFQVDIKNSVKNDLAIARNYYLQPSEYLHKPYFYYEALVEEINRLQEAEEQQRKQQDRSQQSYKMPTYKPPQVNIPKFR
jgi:hypothetical protein